MSEPELLWTPSAERLQRATLTRYQDWLNQTRGLQFEDYDELWRWSVDDLEAFWGSLVEFLDIRFDSGGDQVLGGRAMPGAEWFPGATLSYRRAHLPRQGSPTVSRFTPRVRAARIALDVG